MYRKGVMHILHACTATMGSEMICIFSRTFLLLLAKSQQNYGVFYQILKSLFIIFNFVFFILFISLFYIFVLFFLLLYLTLKIIRNPHFCWTTNSRVEQMDRIEMKNIKCDINLQGSENNCSCRVLSCFKHCLSRFFE